MEVRKGEVVGLIGPNGAGKTTAFNLITGFTPCDSGEIRFEGCDISRMQPHQVTQHGISRTFQNIRLFTGLNVLENVKVALAQSASRYTLVESMIRTPRVTREERDMERRAGELLEMLGISEYAYDKPESLAYGLQRRLEIARALASNPKLLLLDEPAAGLNPSEVVGMTTLIRRINQEFKLTILLIEHHMDVIMMICERIYVLNFGKLIASGVPAEIRANREVLTAYLGDEE
jgi:branched-chain amino acid transport system ATP-binding protein